MYFPKSKILENQYTAGSEFERTDTKQPYTGIYCILSDGRFFTGKTLLNDSIELIKTNKNPKTISFENLISSKIANRIPSLNNLSKQQDLRPRIVLPSDEDYKRGFMTRYFAKKLNLEQIQIFEINKPDYDSVQNNEDKFYPIYQVISMDWKITGPNYDDYSNDLMPVYGIIDTNRRTLEIKEQEMRGIKKYFNERLKEFAK